MATLYVENVPTELYEALRNRARSRHRSIAAETISILEETIPTPAELERRAAFLEQVERLGRRQRRAKPGPAAEDLLTLDRRR